MTENNCAHFHPASCWTRSCTTAQNSVFQARSLSGCDDFSRSRTSSSAFSTSITLSHMEENNIGRFTELHQLWFMDMHAVRFSTWWYQPLGLDICIALTKIRRYEQVNKHEYRFAFLLLDDYRPGLRIVGKVRAVDVSDVMKAYTPRFHEQARRLFWWK